MLKAQYVLVVKYQVVLLCDVVGFVQNLNEANNCV